MKVILFLLILASLFFDIQGAIRISVISQNGPVAHASVTGYTEIMDSTETCLSDSLGVIIINNERTAVINIEHPDFATKIVNLKGLNQNQIYLNPAPKLSTLEVIASNRTQFLTHVTYKLTKDQMKDYSSFFRALDEIPNVIVMPSGGLYYRGESNVALLLNGVQTTTQELSTISKDDILQVDVYDTPPARFAVNGYAAVIDVLTKSGLHGGNIGLNLSQAAVPLWGTNSAALYYNYRRSRFSLRVNNENRHFRKMKENSTLRYEFDETVYEKRKVGHDSKEHIDDSEIIASFQNNLPGSYLYNLEVGGRLNHYSRNSMQDVFTASRDFSARTKLNTEFENYSIRNYFEKYFGEKGSAGSLLGNIRYSHFNNDYHSSYKEFETYTPDSPFENHFNDYRSKYESLFGELQYGLPNKKWGTMTLVAFGNYKKSKYVDSENPFSQKNGALGTELQYYGYVGKFYVSGSAGLVYNYSKTQVIDNKYSKCTPLGRVTVFRYLRPNLYLQFQYQYYTFLPSIAQLSETNQWKDNYLIFHGNAALRPYHEQKIGLSSTMWSTYFDGTLTASYSMMPGMICNHFIRTNDYILETIVNLDRYNSFFSRLSATVKPLGSKKWTISNYINFGIVRGVGPAYSWTSYRFQYNVSTSLQLGRWRLEMEYQHPGKVAAGQLIMPRGQHWQADATYRATDDLFLGLTVKKPFGKDFRDSERTVHTSIVQSETEGIIKDWRNVVMLNLTWNLSFGKKRNNERPKFGNGDADTGILNRYNEK